MARTKGSKGKAKTQGDSNEHPPRGKAQEKKATEATGQKVESSKPELAAGQKYFEDPETGKLYVGDATSGRLWSRGLNRGQGGWLNPKR